MHKFIEERIVRQASELETECHVWAGYITPEGYGQTTYQGKKWQAHRLAWFLEFGELPKYPDYEMDHLCRNRACVNPSHLEAVSCKINQQRGYWASKEFCINGHKYDQENTYIAPSGRRACKKCRNQRAKEYQARKKSHENREVA